MVHPYCQKETVAKKEIKGREETGMEHAAQRRYDLPTGGREVYGLKDL